MPTFLVPKTKKDARAVCPWGGQGQREVKDVADMGGGRWGPSAAALMPSPPGGGASVAARSRVFRPCVCVLPPRGGRARRAAHRCAPVRPPPPRPNARSSPAALSKARPRGGCALHGGRRGGGGGRGGGQYGAAPEGERGRHCSRPCVAWHGAVAAARSSAGGGRARAPCEGGRAPLSGCCRRPRGK